jgi:PAS domain S-box-containing protein
MSEDIFRRIVDNIPGLVSTMTATGEVEFVNRQNREYCGVPLEELRGWSANDLVHSDDLPAVLAAWRHSVETGEMYEIEHRIRRADGEYLWFQVRGVPERDTTGGIVRWYVLLTNIDERKRAEEALRASERDLSLIIETMPGLVWCASPEGDLTYVNQRILAFLGSSREELEAGGWASFLHCDDRDAVTRIWSSCVATGSPFEVQARLRRPDGVYRWVYSVAQPGRDSQARVTCWYGLLVDIDDRKNIEEALRTTEAKLSRAAQIATVGELSASIAHEINQPLAAVVASAHACVRFLSATPPAIAKSMEAAQSIVRDGKEAGEVVRRIRALFKKTLAAKVPLNLNEIISEVLQLLSGEITRRGVIVEIDFEKQLPLVLCDRVQVQQLTLNLLLNAIEAMDPITDRPRKLSIRSSSEGLQALVEIRDCGIGIAETNKVFDAFFTTKANGMGMGLAICRSIVEAHEGRLWFASADGPGTTCCFSLPLGPGFAT